MLQEHSLNEYRPDGKLECVTEALKMNGYTNINVGNTISFRHNNRNYSTTRLRNGIITFTTRNQK